jgi:hypothetical protein
VGGEENGFWYSADQGRQPAKKPTPKLSAGGEATLCIPSDADRRSAETAFRLQCFTELEGGPRHGRHAESALTENLPLTTHAQQVRTKAEIKLPACPRNRPLDARVLSCLDAEGVRVA